MNEPVLKAGTVKKLFRELKASVAKRGIAGTGKFIVYRLRHPGRKESDDGFDKKYNVETASIIRAGELVTKSKNWRYAIRYEPTQSDYSFSDILASFHISYPEYTFIDLGAGKGRAVLLAGMLPFKKVVGVEFSDSLVAIAKLNISRFPENLKLCSQIEMLSMDASEYLFPDPSEKFVLFMNNPFHKPIMEKVIDNVSRSFYLNPRRIIIIYINPQFSSVIEDLPFMQKHEYPEDPNSDLYDVNPEFGESL